MQQVLKKKVKFVSLVHVRILLFLFSTRAVHREDLPAQSLAQPLWRAERDHPTTGGHSGENWKPPRVY